MDKKKVRVYMLHSSIKNVDDIYRYLKLDKRNNSLLELVWDSNEPEYLIATELIYTDSALWGKFVELYRVASICIYYAGECIAPDLNIFDYAIVFDKNLKCEDRIIRMPTRLFFDDLIFSKENELVERKNAQDYLKLHDRKFCNFIYSNGSGHENRTKIFSVLNEYKKVDALGHYLNNVGKTLKTDPCMGWESMIRECIEVKSNYKFSIAFENATYKGYTSEKVFSSLEAHTVPIYWGNPLIVEELNPDAFIDCHKYNTFEDVLEEVKRIDNDDELWMKMVCSPWKTKEQEEQERKEIEMYYAFVENIFVQPLEKALRIGVGFHPERYQEWFFKTQAENSKFKKYHEVESKWIENKRLGKQFQDFFVKNKYKKVAIYGMSQLGLELYYELQHSKNVEIIYGIDQGNPTMPEDLKVYTLNDLQENVKASPDVVVVAVPHLFEIIKMELENYISCRIISIINVL